MYRVFGLLHTGNLTVNLALTLKSGVALPLLAAINCSKIITEAKFVHDSCFETIHRRPTIYLASPSRD